MPGRIAADARIDPCAPEPLAYIDETVRTNPSHRFKHSDIAGIKELLKQKHSKKQRILCREGSLLMQE
jgi:hypothetical protein